MHKPPPQIAPPKLARWLVASRLQVRRDEILDDLDTLFEEETATRGPLLARLHYWWEASNIVAFGIGEKRKQSKTFIPTLMLKNYLIIGLRNLKKHTTYSFINVSGLAIGMASCILILLYVKQELSYDRFHEQGTDIYRLQMDRFEGNEKIFSSAVTFPMVGPTLYDEFPEVTNFARLLPTGGIVRAGDVYFREEHLFFADSSFFEMFSFPLTYGDPANALHQPNGIVLSETLANKYFGSANPVGKTLTINDDELYQVTGVFENIPSNSHLEFDALLSFSTLIQRSPPSQDSWGWYDFYTYIELDAGADPALVESAQKDFMARHKASDYAGSGRWETHRLQPLHDIHLYSNLSWESGINGNGAVVYFLLIIAVFILVIAWVNFVNLSTARSIERAREIGVRKTMGAPRSQLINQFLLESVLINVLAALLAFGLTLLLQARFSELAGVSVALRLTDNLDVAALVLLLFGLGALLSGFYPAFILSSFRPAHVLKGMRKGPASGLLLRKGLVVFQFAVSIVLIAGTMIVFRQLDYVRNLDMGIDIDQTLVVRGPSLLPDDDDRSNPIEAFKNEMLQQTGVRGVAAASTVPGKENFWISSFRTNRMDESDSKDVYIVGVDASFMQTLNVSLLAGRFFSGDFGADEEALILNETASRLLGFDTPEDALTGQIEQNGEFLPIVGVIRDYHQNSMKEDLNPVLFRYMPDIRSYFTLKIDPQRLPETMTFLEASWKDFFPGNPYEYFFLDRFFDQQYQADRQFGRVFGVFSLLAIVVACLGIFGLAAFTLQQRTKEIGIRKVLGASIPDIVGLVSKEYARLVVLSNLIAWPVTYFIMKQWLEEFAYRIDPGIITLIIAGLVALGVAGLTVSYNAFRAARANPVSALHHE